MIYNRTTQTVSYQCDNYVYQVKDGKVILQLRKLETRSWQREISTNGIDQIQEEDEEPGM